ncbi:unnamed protein product [Owenia fusiformis]|uniref:Glycosyltransferase family 92 protein n=1 Tax=Owenia fusiformis TaxID=6347 RepID=A0A8J1Y8Q7_OWEFU|nr:unnamed protein product [Owenia fusiformis]
MMARFHPKRLAASIFVIVGLTSMYKFIILRPPLDIQPTQKLLLDTIKTTSLALDNSVHLKHSFEPRQTNQTVTQHKQSAAVHVNKTETRNDRNFGLNPIKVHEDVHMDAIKVRFDSKTGLMSCPGLSKPQNIPNDTQVFQELRKGDRLIFGFGAYYDVRRNLIRITAIQDAHTANRPKFCQLWKESSNDVTVTKMRIERNQGGHGNRYNGAFLTCPLQEDGGVYSAVSITFEECERAQNIFSIQYPQIDDISDEPANDFNVCLEAPLNLNYSRYYELIEWIEMNRILGASHFTIYNHTSSNLVKTVLESYIKDGIVTLVQWPIPLRVHIWPQPKSYVEEIHYYGQTAMINDCLYRMRHSAKYLVFVDLDEFIIPKKTQTWIEFIKENDPKRRMGGYVFRNVFFRKEWDSGSAISNDQTVQKLKLVTLMKTKKETKIWPPYQRSKLIIDPLKIKEMGAHQIWGEKSGADLVVDPKDGLLHHYRNWENPSDLPGPVDETMLKYKDDLIDAVIKRYAKLGLNY